MSYLRHTTFLFLLVAALFSPKQAEATHIVGGDLTYRYLGGDVYQIVLYLYVDCINGNPAAIQQDASSMVGAFSSNGTLLQTISMNRSAPTRIEAKNYSCVVPPADQCVDLYIFTANAILPDRVGGYTLLFQRCCRNHSILNIINPEATGSTYRTFIPQRASVGQNNSARFIGIPPNFLCTNEPLVYDHSATDLDGDSLVYELFQPLHGASQTEPAPVPSEFTSPTGVIWRAPYSNSNQVASNPIMQLNTTTGLLELIPTTPGQYVVGIAVHEFRKGVKINTVFRDFQFNIYNCVFTVRSNFTPVNGVCSDTVAFQNLSSGSPVRYKWDFGVAGQTNDTSNAVNPVFVFPGPGQYVVRLFAFNNLGCSSESSRLVHILAKEVIGMIPDTIVCNGAQVQLGNVAPEPSVNYSWTPSAGLNNPFIPNPIATVTQSRQYTFRKSSVSCYVDRRVNVTRDSIEADFIHEYLPPCDGLKVKYFAKGRNYNKLTWDFGDRKSLIDKSNDSAASWFYSDSGIVYVKLLVENARCKDSITKPIRIFFPEIFTAVIDTALCIGESLIIGPLNDTSILSFAWSTSEFLNSDQLLYPTAKPTRSMAYVLTKTYAYCVLKDSFNISVNELPDFSVTRSFPGRMCPQDSIFLQSIGNYDFEWSPKQGIRNPFSGATWAQPDSSRWYVLQARTINNCLDYDSVYIELYPMYELNLEPVYVSCEGEAFLPKVAIPDADFVWRERGQDFTIDSIRKEGSYTLKVTTQCQTLLDTFRLRHYANNYCLVDFPNAFTPNDDGINDTYPYGGNFSAIFGEECQFDSYSLIIFNRWGEIVFRSETPGEDWNGTYKNNDGVIEVFGYYLTYREYDWCKGTYVKRVKKGNISALH